MIENESVFLEKSYLVLNQSDCKMAVTLDEFKSVFLSIQHDLKSYILRVTGNREDAADIAQDTYIRAAQSIQSFQGKSSLRVWIFKIASNLVKDHFRAKQRWSVNCMENARTDAYEHPELIDKMKALSEKTPAGKFEIKEHINFCFTCTAKTLPIEQQIALILKDIYEFKVQEIMEILHLSEGKVKHLLADARHTMTDIFEQRCALISKKGACYQCSELNGIFNPKQNAQEELQKIKMVQEAAKGKSKEALYHLRTELVKQIDPLHASGTDLYTYFLSLMSAYSALESEKTEEENEMPSSSA